VVPLSWRGWDPSAWERVWMYRKRFDAPPGADGRRVFLDFAAATIRATVTVNGAEVADHLGGYLPDARRAGRPESGQLAAGRPAPHRNFRCARDLVTAGMPKPQARRCRGERKL
jgi:hypothetical protein